MKSFKVTITEQGFDSFETFVDALDAHDAKIHAYMRYPFPVIDGDRLRFKIEEDV